MIPLKSEHDLAMLRVSGGILAGILKSLEQAVKPGITTAELDALAEELVRQEKVLAAFKGYRGYPATICASVNEEIVHGIPDERALEEGSIPVLTSG